ncbi:hypothetical protein GCM10011585_21880 [Edaphobacter dinghuensis]|uniref:Uncharacterized protein n=1 Tax=Edaphobacter dinghuensis TaxID=1560005 RepID=A0A917M6L5_9BACT|nr:hypothetical protein GCM10011585_21880 [Edaphobacter dinghuensis]
MHDHVHANTALINALTIELTEHDGSDGENHDDFDGYSEGTDNRAQRAMDEITDNQFIHTSTSVWEAIPTELYRLAFSED